MARSLVIVESPAKAKTINKYLGRNYTVKASIGHVMDLPKKTIGIRLPGEEEGGKKKKKKSKAKKGSKRAKAKEIPPGKLISIDDDKIFEPTLQIIAGKGKVINDLRKSAMTADAVYLAGDPDREGEAISAHLAMVLSKPAKFTEQEPSFNRFKKKVAAPEEAVKKEDDEPKKEVVAIDPKKIFRVTFNEITPKARNSWSAADRATSGIDTHRVRRRSADHPCTRTGTAAIGRTQAPGVGYTYVAGGGQRTGNHHLSGCRRCERQHQRQRARRALPSNFEFWHLHGHLLAQCLEIPLPHLSPLRMG